MAVQGRVRWAQMAAAGACIALLTAGGMSHSPAPAAPVIHTMLGHAIEVPPVGGASRTVPGPGVPASTTAPRPAPVPAHSATGQAAPGRTAATTSTHTGARTSTAASAAAPAPAHSATGPAAPGRTASTTGPRTGAPAGTTAAGTAPASAAAQTIDGRTVIGHLSIVATAYGPSLQDNFPYGPVDFFGQPLEPGMVAVDPNVIPLKSYLWVAGYSSPSLPAGGFLARAMDTGGAIRGDRIDIYIDGTPTQVAAFGIQHIQVTLLGG